MSSAVQMAGCTSVSANYLAFARVLAVAWQKFHPDAPFYVLVIDVMDRDVLREKFTIVSPTDLGLDVIEVCVRAGIYGPVELATSLKPYLLQYVLDKGAEAAVYIDPDSELFADIGDFGLAASIHGIALTPHFLRPVPLDGCSPTEMDQLGYGVFNSGLIGVGASATPFLSWWAARISRDGLMDHEAGLHSDQPWLDFVPNYFRCAVSDDPTIHAAWWNLHERQLDVVRGRFLVEDLPLRHFHFSGFDPDHPRRLSRNIPGPLRPGIRESSAVTRLHEEYAAKVLAAGHRDTSRLPYGFGSTASGKKLDRTTRRAYRAGVIEAEATGTTPPPSPFDAARTREFKRVVRRARVRAVVLRVANFVQIRAAARRLTPSRVRRAVERMVSRDGDD